jgi:hypothetical protein
MRQGTDQSRKIWWCDTCTPRIEADVQRRLG